ncbi:MAG TPA: coproporphyrinogen-III oxidase family protein [Candidatus Ozemobacteraceae bacterium]|nr:coproporphyrinogen-III oxidase family protein [Candidatus Ozemobacteraceae bacterium]
MSDNPLAATSLYVHVPFCFSRCDYCGFYSTIPGAGSIEQYLFRLQNESEAARARCHGQVKTVFIGGGNPTTPGLAGIRKLFSLLKPWLSGNRPEEITLETNPETLTAEIVDYLASIDGIRLSMGVQRLKDDELALLGRRARLDSVYRALDMACSRLNNVSIDLILGVPGCPSLADDLAVLLQRFELQHVSAYFLTVEDGSPLQRRILNGELPDPSETGPEELFAVRETLKNNGFEHYEISNYARPGRRCRHNLNYWLAGDYVGLGPSAVSCHTDCRTTNPADFALWLAAAPPHVEKLSPVDRRNEFVMLSLRLVADGLDLAALENRFGPQPAEFSEELTRQIEAGNLEKYDTQCVRLTGRGLAIADNVIAGLFIDG